MSNKVLIGLVVLVAGIAIGWYLMTTGAFTTEGLITLPRPTTVPVASPPTDTAVGESTPFPTITGEVMDKGGVKARTVVTYTDSGFAPAPITVKVGTTVAFANESSRGMWVASAVHPTHQLLPGFDQLKSVAKGGAYEYTFTKVGTWQYHNHVNPTDKGNVVVVE